MPRYYRILLPVVLGLGLVIGALSVASARLGPAVDSVTTVRNMDGVSVDTRIAVSFTEPMNHVSVQKALAITPRLAGSVTWEGNLLYFTPRRPLLYSHTYLLRVGAGARDAAGRPLFHSFATSFHTQSHHLLYLGSAGSEKHELILASLTGQKQVLAGDGQPVTDYSLSPDHTLAVYVQRATLTSRPDEIWMVSLADGSKQRVFRNSNWSISQPHISPDNSQVVFLATNVMICQRYYGCYRDRSGPVIYLLTLRDHRVTRFTSATDVPITNFIDFSPAGQLAFTDLGSALTLANPNGRNVLHIPNDNNSLEYVGFDSSGDKAAFVGQTPDSTGGDVLIYVKGKYLDISRGIYDSSTPAISPDGKHVVYAAYRSEFGIQPVYGLNIYSFLTKKTLQLTSMRAWSDWSPQWSPDGTYISFVRSAPEEPMYMGSGQIWITTSKGEGTFPLGDEGQNVRWVG